MANVFRIHPIDCKEADIILGSVVMAVLFLSGRWAKQTKENEKFAINYMDK